MKRIIAIIPGLILMLAGCNKQEIPAPAPVFVKTEAAALARTAKLYINLELPEGTLLSKVGVIISTGSDPSNDADAMDISKKFTPGEVSYTISAKAIMPRTQYWWQAYYTDSAGLVTYSEIKTFTTRNARVYNDVEYVDLGLSSGNRWATFNVGPQPVGDYYMWMAAEAAVPSEPWRVPSREDWEELMSECFWTWDIQYGMGGMYIEGANGASIFLPASGFMAGKDLSQYGLYGSYLSSDEVDSDDTKGWDLFFGEDFVYWYDCSKYVGGSIRLVAPQFTDYEYN